jgi:hypothetical protein
MPAFARALMHASWFAVLSTVYTRIVLMPSFWNSAISRVQLVSLAMGSTSFEDPPGW